MSTFFDPNVILLSNLRMQEGHTMIEFHFSHSKKKNLYYNDECTNLRKLKTILSNFDIIIDDVYLG